MRLCLSILDIICMIAWIYVAHARYIKASALGSPEWMFMLCAPFAICLCNIFLLFFAGSTSSHIVSIAAAGVWLIISAWQSLTEIDTLVELVRWYRR